MKHIRELTRKLEPYANELVGRPAGTREEALPGSAEALLAWTLQHRLQKTVLLIVNGPDALEARHQDLSALAPHPKPDAHGGPLLYLPPAEDPDEGTAHEDLDLTGERFSTLLAMLDRQQEGASSPSVIATSVQALLQPLPDADRLRDSLMTVELLSEHEIEDLVERLLALGYSVVPEVQDKGQVSVKGGLLDTWPPGDPWPSRIEFFGTQVESIRTFNPLTQRSLDRPAHVRLTPVHEKQPLDGEAGTSTLAAYLDPGTVVLWSDMESIREHADHYLRVQGVSDDAEAAIDGINKTFEASGFSAVIEFSSLATAIKPSARPDYTQKPSPATVQSGPLQPDLAQTARRQIYNDLAARRRKRHKVWLYMATRGALEHVVEEMGDVADAVRTFEGSLSTGFCSNALKLVLVGESDLYGQKKLSSHRYRPGARHERAARQPAPEIADLSALETGDLVVHIEHGVGRYLGVSEIQFDGKPQEVLSLEYADAAKLHLPVTHLHLLSRYVGVGGQRVSLHRLGGKRWQKDKEAAERAVMDLASSLLEVQAHRQMLTGFAFASDTTWQRDFEASFPFRETQDQERVIEEVKRDMESTRPMDRLVCGDAGYGKTEVAMRAAFKAVTNNRQVAVLVPTTILAQQHFQTFSERIGPYPFRLEMLSRFQTQAQRNRIIKGMADGSVDIVIGTHALLQKGIHFRNLGLAIIDEEQRFGVMHKEHLKRMRRLVDVLTLTATPIPRTLYMSLTGARDMSLLQTPPRERMPVETIAGKAGDTLIREAIIRELRREGQVFYLHNRVMSIELIRRKLEKTVPEARIAVGHGQMPASELRTIMDGFINGEYDVLLCTTIIESGVDIPRANTIIIDRADRFGIADLYQLRGRVGRSNRKAYAYLLLPAHGHVDPEARSRIAALRRHSSLGSGFQLAMRDLEIRGAGNVLGRNQSGHITAVGFGLYCRLLQRTVARMKGEPIPPVMDVDLRLDFLDLSPSAGKGDGSIAIPYDYINEDHLRLEIYKRLAEITTVEDLQALEAEVADRFGPVPPAVGALLRTGRLRIDAFRNEIQSVRVREGKVLLMRNGSLLKHGPRFPRLTTDTPVEMLEEVAALVNTCHEWAGA